MNLDELIEQAATSPSQQLRELHAAIAVLVEEHNASQGQPEQLGQCRSLEWKIIRDTKRGKVYGPYPYLRYWQNGHLKSQYLKGYQAQPPPEALQRLEQARAAIDQFPREGQRVET